ncbi:unnamed protein product [Cyprideis torosa]|uniref:Uncharacterized protein n=1 Tax=Cyprideis torosa TaxID=163714 RepID=A0A7R8ZM78_9CRUS|nr:unnamed protein product [Cyprideis torosa]CAG0894937.1 unnamed protein product [Cyprideis torosa]
MSPEPRFSRSSRYADIDSVVITDDDDFSDNMTPEPFEEEFEDFHKKLRRPFRPHEHFHKEGYPELRLAPHGRRESEMHRSLSPVPAPIIPQRAHRSADRNYWERSSSARHRTYHYVNSKLLDIANRRHSSGPVRPKKSIMNISQFDREREPLPPKQKRRKRSVQCSRGEEGKRYKQSFAESKEKRVPVDPHPEYDPDEEWETRSEVMDAEEPEVPVKEEKTTKRSLPVSIDVRLLDTPPDSIERNDEKTEEPEVPIDDDQWVVLETASNNDSDDSSEKTNSKEEVCQEETENSALDSKTEKKPNLTVQSMNADNPPAKQHKTGEESLIVFVIQSELVPQIPELHLKSQSQPTTAPSAVKSSAPEDNDRTKSDSETIHGCSDFSADGVINPDLLSLLGSDQIILFGEPQMEEVIDGRTVSEITENTVPIPKYEDVLAKTEVEKDKEEPGPTQKSFEAGSIEEVTSPETNRSIVVETDVSAAEGKNGNNGKKGSETPDQTDHPSNLEDKAPKDEVSQKQETIISNQVIDQRDHFFEAMCMKAKSKWQESKKIKIKLTDPKPIKGKGKMRLLPTHKQILKGKEKLVRSKNTFINDDPVSLNETFEESQSKGPVLPQTSLSSSTLTKPSDGLEENKNITMEPEEQNNEIGIKSSSENVDAAEALSVQESLSGEEGGLKIDTDTEECPPSASSKVKKCKKSKKKSKDVRRNISLDGAEDLVSLVENAVRSERLSLDLPSFNWLEERIRSQTAGSKPSSSPKRKSGPKLLPSPLPPLATTICSKSPLSTSKSSPHSSTSPPAATLTADVLRICPPISPVAPNKSEKSTSGTKPQPNAENTSGTSVPGIPEQQNQAQPSPEKEVEDAVPEDLTVKKSPEKGEGITQGPEEVEPRDSEQKQLPGEQPPSTEPLWRSPQQKDPPAEQPLSLVVEDPIRLNQLQLPTDLSEQRVITSECNSKVYSEGLCLPESASSLSELRRFRPQRQSNSTAEMRDSTGEDLGTICRGVDYGNAALQQRYSENSFSPNQILKERLGHELQRTRESNPESKDFKGFSEPQSRNIPATRTYGHSDFMNLDGAPRKQTETLVPTEDFNGRNMGQTRNFNEMNVAPTENFNGRNVGPTENFNGRNMGSTEDFNGRNVRRADNFNGRYLGPTENFNGRNMAPTENFNGRNVGPTENFNGRNMAPTGNFNGRNLGPTENFNGRNLGPTENFGNVNGRNLYSGAAEYSVLRQTSGINLPCRCSYCIYPESREYEDSRTARPPQCLSRFNLPSREMTGIGRRSPDKQQQPEVPQRARSPELDTIRAYEFNSAADLLPLMQQRSENPSPPSMRSLKRDSPPTRRFRRYSPPSTRSGQTSEYSGLYCPESVQVRDSPLPFRKTHSKQDVLSRALCESEIFEDKDMVGREHMIHRRLNEFHRENQKFSPPEYNRLPQIDASRMEWPIYAGFRNQWNPRSYQGGYYDRYPKEYSHSPQRWDFGGIYKTQMPDREDQKITPSEPPEKLKRRVGVIKRNLAYPHPEAPVIDISKDDSDENQEDETKDVDRPTKPEPEFAPTAPQQQSRRRSSATDEDLPLKKRSWDSRRLCLTLPWELLVP